LQSVNAILTTYAKALLVDRVSLADAQENNDVLRAEELLRDTFLTDARALVAEASRQAGGAIDPIATFRGAKIRSGLVDKRGFSVATGL
jgi:L-rhamnose isomerase/sugar isomerase